jgi:hypothetical protein
MRGPASLTIALAAGAMMAGCLGPEEVEFAIWANDYTQGDVELWVADELVTPEQQTALIYTATYDSYDDAVRAEILIQTRRDEVVLAECTVHPGACRGTCRPRRESASVCLAAGGQIFLNTWECDCSGAVTDFGCAGDCIVTAP